jgi:hypothetical protein
MASLSSGIAAFEKSFNIKVMFRPKRSRSKDVLPKNGRRYPLAAGFGST